MADRFPERLPRQYFSRQLLDHRVMESVRAVMHGKAEAGFLGPPLHRGDHPPIMVIEEANAAAFKDGRLMQERLDRLRRGVCAIAREKMSCAVLPIDLITRH